MIKKYLYELHKNKVEERNNTTVATPKQFRVGNVGYIDENGDIAAGCHRKAIARCLGLNKDSLGMNPSFEMGFANEAYLKARLPKATEDYDEIVWEKNFGDTTEGWSLSLEHEGITISGHPDLGFKKQGVYIAGGEAKGNSSGMQLEDPYMSDTPKIPNLLQAALYSYIAKVPFYLICQAYAKPSYIKKGLKFEETIKEFKVYIKENKIMYDKENNEAIDSGLSMEGILDYYLLCQELIEKEQLYRTPISYKYDHTKYCSQCHVAEKVNNNFKEWIIGVKNL